jgi:hypothetical protein
MEMTIIRTRRDFLRVTSALSLTTLLEACGNPSPPAAPPTTAAVPAPTVTAPATLSASAPRSNPALPTYLPLASRPKPDYASDGVLYEDGYDNYPNNPQQSWVKPAPGAGSTVTSVTSGLNPPSNSLDSNSAWQAVNKALNATVNFNVVPQQDYTTRLALIMAGDDLPDLMNVFRGISGVNGAAQFLQAKAADLTADRSPPGAVCAAHAMLADQCVIDHLLFGYRLRALFIRGEFSLDKIGNRSQ